MLVPPRIHRGGARPRPRPDRQSHSSAYDRASRFGAPGEPGLDDHLVETFEADPVELHQDRRIAIEVRSREVLARVIG